MSTQLSLYEYYKPELSETSVKFNEYRQKISEMSASDRNVFGGRVFLESGSIGSFYRFSFRSRITAVLEYKLLSDILKDSNCLTSVNKACVEFKHEQLKKMLLIDATLAGNTHEIKDYNDSTPAQVTDKDEAGTWQKKKFYKDLNDLYAILKEISVIISWLGFLNIYRLVSTFARLSWSQFWQLMQDQELLDAHDRLMGHHVNRRILQDAAVVFNFLSVFLFAARLICQVSMVVKHAVWRTPAEAASELDRWELIKRELYTRKGNLINDVAWVLINELTNYHDYWSISEALANTITMYGLIYDLVWILAQLAFKEWEHYDKYWELQAAKLTANANNDTVELAIIQAELDKLDDTVLEVRASYGFQLLAWSFVCTGFNTAIACSSAAPMALGFLACSIGFGMYLSADAFAAYVRTCHVQHKQLGQQSTADPLIIEARNKFIKTLLKSVLVPVFLIGMFTLSWPLALLCAVAWVAYDRYSPEKADKPKTENLAEAEVIEVDERQAESALSSPKLIEAAKHDSLKPCFFHVPLEVTGLMFEKHPSVTTDDRNNRSMHVQLVWCGIENGGSTLSI